MVKEKGSIHTIGSSTRSLEEFIQLLRFYNIELVADVRRFPASRLPHFQRDSLAQLLREAGLDYIYLGNEL